MNGRCYEKSRVDDWIRVALQRSLSELHLRCPHRIDKDRVDLLFRSKTLVKLTLSDGCVIEHLPDGHMDFTDKPFMDEKINEDRFFPSLKSVYLGDIVIDDSYYFKLILMLFWKNCSYVTMMAFHTRQVGLDLCQVIL